MNVVLGSCFRNNVGWYLDRYFRQAEALGWALEQIGAKLHIHAVEGDSVDRTYFELHQPRCSFPVYVTQCHHGGPEYGSVEAPERMQALSAVGNAILDGVHPEDDFLIYVESDLVWSPDTMLRLLERVRTCVTPSVIAPLVFAGTCFYDVYAFRGLDGSRFAPFHPYHGTLLFHDLTPVSSVGSCLVMPGQIARSVRMTTGALPEFCANARAAGFTLYADARERISHP